MPLLPSYFLLSTLCDTYKYISTIHQTLINLLDICKKKRNISDTKKQDPTTAVLACLRRLRNISIDGSILMKIGIGKTINTLCQDDTLDTVIRDESKAIKMDWKKQVNIIF